MDKYFEETHDLFFEELKNSSEDTITKALNQLGVFVWGNYIASHEVLNDANEPNLSKYDLARLDERHHEMLSECLDDAFKGGEKLVQPKGHNKIKLYSSELFPVDDDTVKLVEAVLNTFDAVVVNNRVHRGSYLNLNLPDAYLRCMSYFDDWEDDYIVGEDL